MLSAFVFSCRGVVDTSHRERTVGGWTSGRIELTVSHDKTQFEVALVEVWRQVLVENSKRVRLGTENYSVRRTAKRRLAQVDFIFDGNDIRGLEQNPETRSRWAQLARSRKKVMQFLSKGRYVANVVDGRVTLYDKKK